MNQKPTRPRHWVGFAVLIVFIIVAILLVVWLETANPLHLPTR